MLLVFDDRPSTSPLIERVWRRRASKPAGSRRSRRRSGRWSCTRHRGTVQMTVRGPETRATDADCPADGEWLGIRFRFGTFMPQIPVARVLDRNDVDLPHVAPNAFWLDGRAWEYPSWENAETFVQQLVRHGLIGYEPLVDAASVRSGGAIDPIDQRRSCARPGSRAARIGRSFARGTSRSCCSRCGDRRRRARRRLLRPGAPHAIGETAHRPRRPDSIARGETQLSFLYKTDAS
jgi:hypothetical protein